MEWGEWGIEWREWDMEWGEWEMECGCERWSEGSERWSEENERWSERSDERETKNGQWHAVPTNIARQQSCLLETPVMAAQTERPGAVDIIRYHDNLAPLPWQPGPNTMTTWPHYHDNLAPLPWQPGPTTMATSQTQNTNGKANVCTHAYYLCSNNWEPSHTFKHLTSTRWCGWSHD